VALCIERRLSPSVVRCEIDRLHAVGEHQSRAMFFVRRLRNDLGLTGSLLGPRRVPDESVDLTDECIGMTVTVLHIDELQVGERMSR